VFEHFVEPVKELDSLLKVTDTVIFSTEIYPSPLPSPENWWYFGLDHGQHISFYSKKTLNYLADKFNINYYRVGSLHIFSKKEISNFTLFLPKLSKFGFEKIIERKMSSKVWSDYERLSKGL
jgi:hypothetical protein